MRHRHVLPALAALAALLMTGLVTGCAAPDEASPAGNDDESQAEVTTLEKDDEIAGVVRVASGVSFPPMEFFDTDNETVLGFDADLGKALGEVLGVEFEFHNTNFDGIIGGLNADRYDLALTSMIDKKERQETVDFVDYLSSGLAFMTLKDNPEGLTSEGDLCGVGVAVEKAATGDLVADDLSADCEKNGEEPLEKLPFPDQASAVQALKSGRADDVLALDVTLAYKVSQDPDSFEDSTELRDAVQAALKKVQDEGVYDQLLTKWNLEDQALEGAPINTGE